MEQTTEAITIEAHIAAPIEKVWKYWTQSEHITQWNFASDDWQCPKAENDLRVGGLFTLRMEAKDGNAGFDFAGTYTKVEPHSKIAYAMEDGRKVEVLFTEEGDSVKVVEIFDPENQNSLEMQKNGWQAILNNFKKHVEST